MTQPTVFISYSRRDEKEKDELLSHLGVLQRAGIIDVWNDDRIGAGSDWQTEINRAIDRAKVAILLISAAFLNSEKLEREVSRLLQRRQGEGLVVFPIIAKECAWRKVEWLARIVRPKDEKPVWREGGRYADEELARIAEEVAGIIEKERGASVAGGGAGRPAPAFSTGQPGKTPATSPAESVGQQDSGAERVNIPQGSHHEVGNVGGHLVSGRVGGDITGDDKIGGDSAGRDIVGGDVIGRDNITNINIEAPKEAAEGLKGVNWEKVGAIVGIIGLLLAIAAFAISADLRALIWPSPPEEAPAASFTYLMRVQDKNAGQDIANAVVTIEVGGKAPLDAITDSTGLARIFVSADHSGQPGRLIVEAEGYNRHTQNIDLMEGDLPKVVPLEPVE